MSALRLSSGAALTALAMCFGPGASVAMAQHAGHQSRDPTPPAETASAHDHHPQLPATTVKEKHASKKRKAADQDQTPRAEVTDHSKMDHAGMNHPEMDHAAMQDRAGKRTSPPPPVRDATKAGQGKSNGSMKHPTEERPAMNHGAMAQGSMEHGPTEHGSTQETLMGHGTSTHSATKHGEETPLQHSMPTMPANRSATDAPREPIPTVSASDRAAAFPAVQPHAMHGTSSHRYLSVDRLELRDGDEGNVAAWEATGWVGGDTDRFWLRTEGEHADGRIESGNVEVFKGRAIARWWDAVAGIRHDFGEGPSQTFAAIGVMGLAPYKFEFEATAYLGTSGQTAINLETEYETLFTNRLILQSVVEINAYGKDDARRGIGSGLSSIEAGLRLRYEFTRQFAPYVGIMRERKFGRTADFAEADGAPSDDTLLLAGVRLWF